MNRRQAVQRVSLLLGGSILGAELFLQTGCKPGSKEKGAGDAADTASPYFTAAEIAFLDEIAETILPRTATPGARDAKVGAFMNVMVRDCYTQDDQKIFKEGMDAIKKRSEEKYQADFMKMQAAQRTELLTALDKEAKDYADSPDYKTRKYALDKEESIKDSVERSKGNFGYSKRSMPQHYFRMMKELTLLGFFTSEPGATKALRYAAVPGKYDPCMPYKKGDRAWATS